MKPRRFFLATVVSWCWLFASYGQAGGDSLGGIVLDDRTDRPVEGVRVSIGFTDSITYTDGSGAFSFGHVSAVTGSPRQVRHETVVIRKTPGGGLVDLHGCPSVTGVEIYNVLGRCVCRHLAGGESGMLRLNGIPEGMYVVRLIGANGRRQVLKWNSMNVACRSAVRTAAAVRTVTGQASTAPVPLVLRHDSYYPLSVTAASSPLVLRMKPDPRAEVFDQTKIGRYDFTMTVTDSLQMERNAIEEEYVPAEFSYNGVTFGKVGLRYKGSSYSLPNCFEEDGTRKDKPVCRKISMKVKFDKYIDSLRFYKMKRLNLHSESADETKLHDILSYGLFREMGITAPRCAFAEIFVNGVFGGLFCAVEDIDGRFTDARWPDDGDGNLYKEKWPISPSENYYRQGLVTNDAPEDSAEVTRMVRFYEAVNGADRNTFKSRVAPFLDFDYWLHYIAVDRVIHNADGIMTWYVKPDWFSNHNYYFYEPSKADSKLWIIPWDLHVTFSKKDPIIDMLGVPEWNVAPEACDTVKIWGDQDGMPPHCDKLTGLTADVLWDDFVRIAERMLRTCFDIRHVQNRIDLHRALIDSVIGRDPHVDHASWTGQVNSLRNDIVVLHNDFDDYIHLRSVDNDTAAYLTPFDGTGFLVLDKCNNFEFTPTGNEKTWSGSLTSTNSSISVKHDTAAPLWGRADVLYSFAYVTAPGTGKYREWGRAVLEFENTVDFTDVAEIRVNLKGDSKRNIWIYLDSPAYGDNDVSVEYGWWDGVSARDSLRVFTLSTIAYPEWAEGNPPDILGEVLTNVRGIGFSANPVFDQDGELAESPDSGYMRIDNVRFIVK